MLIKNFQPWFKYEERFAARAEKLMSFMERNAVYKDAICKHVGLQMVNACRIIQLAVQRE